MHDTLQMYGAARTGRWGGRGLQIQNLKRPTVRDPDACAEALLRDPQTWRRFHFLDDLGSLVRLAIAAPEGYLLVVVDLSAIESRVLGWLAGEDAINRIFREQLDTYKAFAVEWLGKPYESITKAERTLAKPPCLGAGYGIGAAGLMRYAEGMGVAMTEDECASAVNAYRSTYPAVPRFWYAVEEAFRDAVLEPGVAFGKQGQFLKKGRFLRIQLPSGRSLYYDDPLFIPGEGLSYVGQDSFSQKWQRIRTWGSRLTENIVQAVARDILEVGLHRFRDAGGRVVAHVHDEIVGLSPADEADKMLGVLIKAMTDPIDWAPGLLLDASGYVASRYRKD
jgi:DNA polymerase